MRAILFLIRKSVKNTLLELLHHPSKLIAYLFVIALVLFGALSNANAFEDEGGAVADIRWLQGIFLALLMLVTLPTLFTGTKTGASLFTLSDVNMLFCSPLSNKKILIYGLMKKMGTTLLALVFLVVYGGMIMSVFGLTIGQTAGIFLAFALMICLAQLMALMVYCVTNGSPVRTRLVRTLVGALGILPLLYVGWVLLRQGLSLESALGALSSPVLDWVPLFGWMRAVPFALMAGDTVQALVYIALLAATAAISALVFWKRDVDYYEDVLQNAETAYEVRQSMKEGNTAAAFKVGKTPKVRDTGIRRGWGANSFFFKHLREQRRQSRLWFFTGTTWFVLALCLFMALVFRFAGGDSPEDAVSPEVMMFVCVGMGVYMQLFLTSAGQWGRELDKPYLYLVPAPAFQKLLWASASSLLQSVIDGVVVFAIIGAIAGADPLLMGMCMLLYASFGWTFTALNLVSRRLFGRPANRGLLLVLFLLVVLVLAIPGIVGTVVFAVLVPGLPAALVPLPLLLWNMIETVGTYAIGRGMLNNMELA